MPAMRAFSILILLSAVVPNAWSQEGLKEGPKEGSVPASSIQQPAAMPEHEKSDAPVVAPSPQPVPPQVPPMATSEPAPASRRLLLSAGMGLRNTHWSHIEDPSNTNAQYDVADAQNTILEGDISIPQVAVKFGFNVQQSGGVSDIKQAMGYLGFKAMTIKTERGKFSGRATHNAPPVPARTVNFDQAYQFTECDFSLPFDASAYIGLRYTVWKLPAEMALLGPEKSSGPTIFDADFQSEFYSLIMGMDFFKRDLLYTPEKFSAGWGVMFTFLTGLGWGKSKISDQAAKDAKTYYGKTLTEQTPPVFTVHMEGQLGPLYNFNLGGFRGAVGVGYDVNLLMLINSGRNAEKSTEAQPVAYPNFTYQGWIARLHTVF